MGLADAIAAATKRPGTKCHVGQVRKELPPADVIALDEAFANPRVTCMAIVNALRSEGHAIGRSPVERHRRGDCACGTR